VLRCFFLRPTALTARMLPGQNVTHVTLCKREAAVLWSDSRTSGGRGVASSLSRSKLRVVFSSRYSHGRRLPEPRGSRCLPDNSEETGARSDSADGVEAWTQSDCDESDPVLEP
jgi:hypothetical protein